MSGPAPSGQRAVTGSQPRTMPKKTIASSAETNSGTTVNESPAMLIARSVPL